MTTPTHCTSCGHELGIGRFCTNCGKPVAGRHPGAMPASGAPVVPPPVGTLPPAPRYPLYADTLPPPPAPAPPVSPYDAGRRGARRWLRWAAGATVLVVAALLGTALVVAGGGADDRAPTSADQDTSAERPLPDSSGTGGPIPAPDPDDVADLTGRATAEVPGVAPPSRDRGGRPVDFEAANLFDGRARTAWRVAGDASGSTLVFDLGGPVVLTDVGLVNGYAKVDGPVNWYLGNRRVRAVQWEFDDGTRITQELREARTMQSIEIDPVETTTIQLHLVSVTVPGSGSNGRDYTALSEVSFRGAPG